MKSNFKIIALIVLLSGLTLSACGGAAAPKPSSNAEMPAAEAPAVDAYTLEEPAAAPQAGAAESSVNEQPAANSENFVMATAMPPSGSDAPVDGAPVNVVAKTARMIIKNADIKLMVEDTDIAIDRATQVVGDAGGYIVSSRVWSQPYGDGKSYKYATLTIGVPVAEFEHTLVKLRGLSLQVLDETASGEDVSNQFVDLQSQVTNLEATRDRIKTFLDQSTTVDEALRINQQLSEVEAQIEQIKGQMNYLQDRSAYSTITINFEPKLPEILPTPTATPIPTATPESWKPGETFTNAKQAVTYAYQGIFDFLIWFFVVLVPIFLPPVLVLWGLWKLLTRKSKKPTQ